MQSSETEQRITPERFWLVFFSVAAGAVALCIVWILLWQMPFVYGPGNRLMSGATAVAAWITLGITGAIVRLLSVILLPREPRAAVASIKKQAPWLVLAAVPALASFGLYDWRWKQRIDQTERLSSAVEAYVSDHGDAPATLERLWPTYLPGMPGDLPKLRIAHGAEIPSDLRTAVDGSAPAWAIYAFTGTGSDLLFYLPAARYPERIRGGRLERVGGWAYLHD